MNRILFIPSVQSGRGTGHLARCAAWSKRLPGSALSLHETDSPDTFPSGTIRNRCGLVDGSTVMRIEPDRWDAAVLDRFATSLRELAGMGLEMPVIGIDEGGGARVSLSYLIDTLPGGDGTANVSGLGFLDLPERAKDFPEKRERVIVCFGGEDRAGLTSAVARLLVSSGRAEPENVLAVRGALADPATLPAGIRASGPVEDLKSRLHDFDLVVTSFGLTAFEAIAAGTPVILVNPTSYHDRLAGLSGIPFARRGLGWERRFLELFDDAGSVSRACAEIDIGARIDMPGFLAELDAARDSGCPACRSLKRSALLRDRERSFFRCGACGITYEILFGADPTGYGREYFVEEYRNQYGRTYLEDFDVIRANYFKQLKHMIRHGVIATLIAQQVQAEQAPRPFFSPFTQGCMENGRDLVDGGARYPVGPVLTGIGIADMVNSLAAIQYLVFDKQITDLKTLCQALDKNWKGFEDLRQKALACPKFGNDEDSVDRFATEISNFYHQEISRYTDIYGSPFNSAFMGISNYIPAGKAVGATPCGRRTGDPLTEGCSPHAGTDDTSPTAAMRSTAKIDHGRHSGGTLLNIKFSPDTLKTQGDLNKLAGLIRGYYELDAFHVQFNVFDKETLLAAQQTPENHKHLLVRVAGYSARFITLSKEVQDAIIERTSYSL